MRVRRRSFYAKRMYELSRTVRVSWPIWAGIPAKNGDGARGKPVQAARRRQGAASLVADGGKRAEAHGAQRGIQPGQQRNDDGEGHRAKCEHGWNDALHARIGKEAV